jgi:hypothetical protein
MQHHRRASHESSQQPRFLAGIAAQSRQEAERSLLESYRARYGTQLEHDGVAALRLFETEQDGDYPHHQRCAKCAKILGCRDWREVARGLAYRKKAQQCDGKTLAVRGDVSLVGPGRLLITRSSYTPTVKL